MPSKGLRGKGPLAALVGSATVALFAVGVAIALGAAGDLDTSFSSDGKATINFGGDETYSYLADVAVAPNGNAIVVGTTTNVAHPLETATGIAVASVKPDGTLDPSFSGDGLTVIERGAAAEGTAVVVQPNGKIVIGGTDTIESGKTFLDALRLNADGSPDTTFGPGGFRSVDFGNLTLGVADVAIAPDGKIVLGGYLGTSPNYDYEIARFNADGSVDTPFGGGDGKATFSFTADDGAYEIAVQPDGKIVMAGENNSNTMEVIRVNADGTLDSGFGLGGRTIGLFTQTSAAYAVALQSDGRIVVAGFAGSPNSDLAVVRLEPSGALDPTFSDDGKLTKDLGATSGEEARGVAIQPDGKIVVGGVGGPSDELVALRLDASGAVDTTFGGGDGLVGVGFASAEQEGGDVAIQPDGKILLSGVTYNNRDFAIARFNGDPGTTPPDNPPGGDGDTKAPETAITKFPKNKSHKSKAKYKYESSESNSSFECALDSKNFVPCGDGKEKYKHLDFGTHKFLVRATDAAGNTDQTPARDKFKRKHG